MFRLCYLGGNHDLYNGCVGRCKSGLETIDHPYQPGNSADVGLPNGAALSRQGVPDTTGDTERSSALAEHYPPVDTDWPPAPYHPPQPEPPDTDWPALDYKAPVVTEEPVRRFAVGSRVRVLGVGYGTVARRWEGWIVVRCDLLGMVVGKHETELRSA